MIEYSLGQDPGVVTSANVNVGVPQLSVAVGVVHDGVPVHSIVVGAGNAEITGGTVSSTLIVWEAVVIFPHASVAVHVLVILYEPGQEPGVLTSAKVSVGVPQLSVAVGVVHDGIPEHSIVVGAGSAEITGGTVSSTLIVCEAVVIFPQASVAVHVLVILYDPEHPPGVVTSAKVNVGVLQLSVAVGVVHDGVPEHSIVVGAGKAEITGGVVSSTLIVCDALAIFPHASIAVHVLVMEYSFGQLPGVVTSANVRAGVPQLSVAVGVVHDGVPVHSIVDGPGSAEITGGVVSSTLID